MITSASIIKYVLNNKDMNEDLQLTKIVAFLKELKEEIENNDKACVKKLAIKHKIIGSAYVSVALSKLNYVEVTSRVGATKFLLTTIDKKVAKTLLKTIRNHIQNYNKERKSRINKENTFTTQNISNFGGTLSIKNGFYIINGYKISGTFEIEKYEV